LKLGLLSQSISSNMETLKSLPYCMVNRFATGLGNRWVQMGSVGGIATAPATSGGATVKISYDI